MSLSRFPKRIRNTCIFLVFKLTVEILLLKGFSQAYANLLIKFFIIKTLEDTLAFLLSLVFSQVGVIFLHSICPNFVGIYPAISRNLPEIAGI